MVFESQLLEFSDIQLIDGDRGKNYPKHDDFINSGDCLFLSAKNVTPNGFEFSDTIFINKEKDAQLRAGKLELGDIVVTTRGTIGNVALYDETVGFEHIRINSGMMIFRANPEVWNYRFLYFILTSGFIRKQIETLTSGSAVPQLPAKDLKKFKLPKVSKDIQDVIADNVGTLVDKITLNRQINQTLEQMAQTLFKSWFVDFDPVIDNALDAGNEIPEPLQARAELRQEVRASQDFQPLPADVRALFPAEFEESELGWVPKGWDVQALGDMVTVKRGGSPRPIHDFLASSGLPWIKISDATASNSRFITGTKEFIKKEGLNKTVYLKKGELILSNSATPGLPKFIDLDACIHDGWLYFPQKHHLTDLYLYQLFLEIRPSLVQQGNGSVFTNLKTDILKQHKLTVPTSDVLISFDGYIETFHKKIHQVCEEIESLTSIRDTLLPKLISGELRLDEIPAP